MIIKNNKGYTLIELIVVLAILSIVVFITFGNLNINQDILLSKCANQLANDIRYIQRKTITEKQTNYKINANYAANNTGYTINLGYKIIESVKFDKGITYTSNFTGPMLSFNLLGRPSNSGTYTLRNSKGKTINITVVPSTGRVRIYK